MIVARAPYRISLLGGGSDFPAHFTEHGGRVLSMAIDRHCWVSVRVLPPFFPHRYRIVYSRTEECRSLAEIEHPVVRVATGLAGIVDGLEVHHDGDLPARSGIGSSSAFTVAYLHALAALQGRMPSKAELACDAIMVERVLLDEPGGWQDQVACAHGGLNLIEFVVDGGIRVDPVTVWTSRKRELAEHLLLVYTGVARTGPSVAGIYDIGAARDGLLEQAELAKKGSRLLSSGTPVEELAGLLRRAWEIKQTYAQEVGHPTASAIYRDALEAGALGGKLLGAGGGGFLLLVVRPRDREAVLRALTGLVVVPFRVDEEGSRVVLHEDRDRTAGPQAPKLDFRTPRA